MQVRAVLPVFLISSKRFAAFLAVGQIEVSKSIKLSAGYIWARQIGIIKTIKQSAGYVG